MKKNIPVIVRKYTIVLQIIMLSALLNSANAYVSHGSDPFHQPYNTTLYHGSGDVNSDGKVDNSDLALAQAMAGGSAEQSVMADVNGDGKVSDADVSVLSQYLSKSIDHLPGWWNSLTTREERTDWLKKAIACDGTDSLPYDIADTFWFVCKQFAVQTALHLTGNPGTLEDNLIEGGQIGWNIPAYEIYVTNHAINGVLVGDNPLDINDWYVLEPQFDNQPIPGDWDLPPGPFCIIAVVADNKRIANSNCVSFKLNDDLTFTLDSSSIRYDFVTTRIKPDSLPPDNSMSQWRNRCVSGVNDFLVCNRTRTDMSGNYDIYIGDYDSAAKGYFPTDSRSSILLDVCKGSGSIIYMLWREKTIINKPALFIGTYDLSARMFRSVDTISDLGGYRYEGKLLYMDDSRIFAFWTENCGSFGSDPTGIYFTEYNGSTCRPYRKVIDFVNEYELQINKCYFDAALTDSGKIILVSRNKAGVVYERDYSVTEDLWSDSSVVSDTAEKVQDVCLAKDKDGKMHLFYSDIDESVIPAYVDSSGNKQYSCIFGQNGKIMRRTFDGNRWSVPQSVPGYENASAPEVICASDGSMYLACVNTYVDGNHYVYDISTCRYRNGTWTETVVFKKSENELRWPSFCISGGNRLDVLWESYDRDCGRVTVNRAIATQDSVYESVKERRTQSSVPFAVQRISAGRISLTPSGMPAKNVTASVVDLSGRTLFRKTYTEMRKTEYVDLSRYSSGTLFLLVKSGSSIFTYKFVNYGM